MSYKIRRDCFVYAVAGEFPYNIMNVSSMNGKKGHNQRVQNNSFILFLEEVLYSIFVACKH